MSLEITDVRVKLINTNTAKAVASIVIDNAIAIDNIYIYETTEGKYSISMPARKVSDDKYVDFVHPISAEARAFIQDKIVAAYLAIKK